MSTRRHRITDLSARLILVFVGAVVTLVSGLVLGYPILRPEIGRRGRLVAEWVNDRGKELGLRGRFAFSFSDWSPGGSVGGGRYEPSGEEDRLLFERIGGQLEGEGVSRVDRMVWTDRAFAVVGLTLLVIGA